MEFKFTNEYPLHRVDEIISYLTGPRLWIPQNDYPDFFDWAQKAHRELKKELKRATIALCNNDVVGVVVYQKDKIIKDALEIKNITVRPDKRGRYIASFLLRNTEIEGVDEFKSSSIICDAKARNLEMMYFLQKHGYRITGKNDLYQLNTGQDLVYKKDVNALLCKMN